MRRGFYNVKRSDLYRSDSEKNCRMHPFSSKGGFTISNSSFEEKGSCRCESKDLPIVSPVAFSGGRKSLFTGQGRSRTQNNFRRGEEGNVTKNR